MTWKYTGHFGARRLILLLLILYRVLCYFYQFLCYWIIVYNCFMLWPIIYEYVSVKNREWRANADRRRMPTQSWMQTKQCRDERQNGPECRAVDKMRREQKTRQEHSRRGRSSSWGRAKAKDKRRTETERRRTRAKHAEFSAINVNKTQAADRWRKALLYSERSKSAKKRLPGAREGRG